MGRTPISSKDAGLTRGAWTVEEDKILIDYVENQGQGKWSKISKKTGLRRCGKSCRLRWLNYLRPDIKRGNITEDEEDIIIRLHKLLGNRWSLIAGRIPGRTDNEIKNYWNTTLKKKMDPKSSNQGNKNDDKVVNSSSEEPGPCFSDIKAEKKDEVMDSRNWVLSNNCYDGSWDLENVGGGGNGHHHQIGSLDFPAKGEEEQGGMMLFSSSSDADLSYEDLKGMNWSDEDINLVLQFALDA